MTLHRPRPAIAALAATALLTLAVPGSLPAAQAAPGWLPATVVATGARAVDVGVDRVGNATAVWVETPAAGRALVRTASRPAGGGWSDAVTLAEGTDAGTGAQVEVAPDGTAVAAFSIQRDPALSAETLASVRAPGGAWATSVVRGHGGSAANSSTLHRLVLDDAGNALVQGTAISGGAQQEWTSTRPAGGAWGAPQALPPLGGNYTHAISLRGDTATAVSSLNGTVQALTQTGGGAWSPPQVIASGIVPGEAAPAVVTTPQGAAVALWSLGSPPQVGYSVRVGGAWSAPAALPGVAGGVRTQELASDAAGNITAVFQAHLGGAPPVVLAMTLPAGGSWSAAQPLSSPGVVAGLPGLDVAPNGATAVAWQDFATADASVHVSTRLPGGEWRHSPAAGTIHPSAARQDVAVDEAGDALIGWRTPTNDGAVRGFDTAGPRIDALSVPGDSRAKRVLTFTASTVDTWAGVTGIAWDFGDGRTAQGARVEHAYRKKGSYTVTLTSTDALGNATARTATIKVGKPDRAAGGRGAITALKFKPRRISASGRHGKKKTKALVRVTEAGQLKITLSRKAGGKKSKARKVATLTRRVPVGTSTIVVKSRIKVGKRTVRLKPGTYRVKAVLKSSAGRSTRTAKLVVRR